MPSDSSPHTRILVGDARERLKELPAGSVHCVVTSPPYWGLRTYQGGEGMIGLEPAFDEHLDNLTAVFAEVWRVLRDDGTLWLNYGDAHSSGSGRMTWAASGKPVRGGERRQPVGKRPKDLLLMPFEVASALRERLGWYIRSEIVWKKANPIPEPVFDRPTSAHEKVWLMTKRERYFYDAFAVRVPRTPGTIARGRYEFNSGSRRPESGVRGFAGSEDKYDSDGTTAHLRNVWECPSAPFPEAHFATFPPAIVEPCVKAGTSEHGVCGECGAPWERKVKRRPTGFDGSRYGRRAVEVATSSGGTERSTLGSPSGQGVAEYVTVGWKPGCGCGADVIPAVVLDPFGGAGTVAVVANHLERSAVLVEISADYADMACRRVERERNMFADVRVLPAPGSELADRPGQLTNTG